MGGFWRVVSRSERSSLFELAWRQHDRNEPAVAHDVHASERSDVFEQAAEVVLRVGGRHPFRHLANLAEIIPGSRGTSLFLQPVGDVRERLHLTTAAWTTEG